ncbi:MAG: NADH-quinone oxidoreductase subunit K [Pirellulales bacterium]
MNTLSDFVLIAVILTNLVLLGVGRLRLSIRLVAAQGMALGLMPLLVSGGLAINLWIVAAGSFFLKGLVFPALLLRAMRLANVRREAAPIVGYTASMVLGVALLAFSFWTASRFVLPPDIHVVSDLALPTALATILCGLFLLITRRQALMQVLGYLVLENGIFLFGVALAHEEPLMVEMGILLDVFVAVFVMGIIVFHISREFDHIDVEKLSQLKG